MNAKVLLPPEIKAIRTISPPGVSSGQLSNGLSTHFVLMGTQEVVKIELTFWAGRTYEKGKLIARTTAALIKDGTPELSNAKVAEFFDFHGAGISIPSQTDTSTFSIFCLSNQVVNILPLFIELLNKSAFREEDLRSYISRQQHRLKEDLTKNEVIAYRQITECFYGKNHPYGYNSLPDSYLNLSVENLRSHSERCYNANNGFAMISGQIDEATKVFICKQLENIPSGKKQNPKNIKIETTKPKDIFLPGHGTVQSTIRIGRKLFPRHHKDANAVFIMSSVLGGYFGSRLMTNIREKKGFTYQVSAAYESLQFDGAFQIDTEVSPDFIQPCLREIQLEIERMQNDLVPEKELEMVRNYLMGSFLSMVDGPFNWSETLRTLLIEELDINAFQSLVTSVQEVKSDKIRDIAQSYLKKEDLWTLVVGE